MLNNLLASYLLIYYVDKYALVNKVLIYSFV